MNLKEMLKTVDTVLVVDWPTKEVPEMLALAGFHVIVRGGPGPQDYSAYELNEGEVLARRAGHPPERADLVYSYRPFSELPEIIATARNLHAKTYGPNRGCPPLVRRTRRVVGFRTRSYGWLGTSCNRQD